MIARTAVKVGAHLDVFSGRLSAGLPKVARRFVGEAMYGIAARQSVRLSEIGRALEEPIALAKTETRLSRNLGRPELRGHVGAAVLREGAGRIRERTLLILDTTDITKPYAEKMEYLARVRDGSTGEIADGYWLCQVIGVENEDNAITPLYSTLYSQRAPDFVRPCAGGATCCGGWSPPTSPAGASRKPSASPSRATIWKTSGVLTYERLRNLVALVNAVAFFTAVELGTRVKLAILATHLIKAAKRLFGVPDFRLYAIADGIRHVCARVPRRTSPPQPPDPQLLLLLT